MPDSIIFIDSFAIREGKLEDLKQGTKELVELIQSDEPQMLVYNVYIDEAAGRMTGVQMHPDSASIEKHFAVAGPHFGKIMESLEPGGTMQVFGSPSEQVRRQMAQMASSMGVTLSFYDLAAGFARL